MSEITRFPRGPAGLPQKPYRQKAKQDEDIFLRKTPTHFFKPLFPSIEGRDFSSPEREGHYNLLDPIVLKDLTPAPLSREPLTPLGFKKTLEDATRSAEKILTQNKKNPPAFYKTLLPLLRENRDLIDDFYTRRMAIIRA